MFTPAASKHQPKSILHIRRMTISRRSDIWVLYHTESKFQRLHPTFPVNANGNHKTILFVTQIIIIGGSQCPFFLDGHPSTNMWDSTLLILKGRTRHWPKLSLPPSVTESQYGDDGKLLSSALPRSGTQREPTLQLNIGINIESKFTIVHMLSHLRQISNNTSR